jgi:type II secretory ATPase GspE/PulE/Tfp pilus assembly ATPase PilB-like protein
MDQTLFDLKLNEAKLYFDQGLKKEANGILENLLSELKDLPKSKETAIQIEQVQSLSSSQGMDSKKASTPLTLKKKSDEDLFIEASVLKDIESYGEAITNYKTLVDHGFTLHDTISGLMGCYRQMGELKKAGSYLSSLIKDSSTTPGKKDICYYFQSSIYEELENYVTAMQALKSIVSSKKFHDYDNRRKALQSKIKGRTKFDYLLSNRLISKKDLINAKASAPKEQKSIEYILINSFDVPVSELGKSLSMYYGYPFIDLSKGVKTQPELFTNLKQEYLKKNYWAPLSKSIQEKKIKIAIDDPSIQKKDDINKIYIGNKLEFIIAVKEHIIKFIDTHFDSPVEDEDTQKKDTANLMDEIAIEFDTDVNEDDNAQDDASVDVDSKVIMFVNKMIMDAAQKRASDIHIEPSTHSKNADIRFRVDGICKTYIKIPNNFCRSVISRTKIMARMDITEKRKPLDGKIKFKSKNTGAIELRVATIPTCGNMEDVVLRLLQAGKPMKLTNLGVLDYILEDLLKIIQKSYGLVLVVGPTGSGKTTTLHSALNIINTPERKIWTAEDPVEIDQYGIRQAEVHNAIGLDFATLLRSFLRADPDVIMVGEMRDVETTKTAIEASLTGHLVFSTLHTNNAPETVTRLLEMGIDPTNFADSLLGILSQRLGRTLCKSCKEPVSDQKTEIAKLIEEFGEDRMGIIKKYQKKDMIIYQPKGCPDCDNTGFLGRVGFHEFLLNNDEIKHKIKQEAGTEPIRQSAVKGGMYTLKQDGILKVFMGLTDLAEVRRTCI